MKLFKQRVPGMFVKKTICPQCRSEGSDRKGDNLAIYKQKDGTYDATCFKCGYYTKCDNEGEEMEDNVDNTSSKKPEVGSMEAIQQMSSMTLFDRNIKKNITEFFGVKSEVVDGKEIARYYPITKDGKLVGYKKRGLPKEFTITGYGKRDCDLFGQSKFSGGGKILIIVEGEEDALASYRITEHMSPGKRGYPVVSIVHGINTAVQAIKQNYDFVSSYDKVVFNFDNEPEAQEIAKQCCALLEPGKGFISTLPLKDASDMCVAKRFKEYYNAVWNGKLETPAGIVVGSDTWDAWKNRHNYECIPFPEAWGLNNILQGIRIGGLYTVGAGTGVGKSTMLKILQLSLFRQSSDNIGVIALEEPLCDSVGMLMGLYLNKRIHIPGVEVDEADEKKAWEVLFKDDRFIFEQAFGAMEDDTLFNRIRFMVKAQGCKYIFLDHLTALTDMYGSGQGSKVEQTAKLVAKIKSLTQELDCAIIMVSHLRKTSEQTRSYEEGAVPGLDSLYGAAAIKQYSDAVITIARDQREEVSLTTYHVIKNRLTGRMGKGNPLVYNFDTGWLEKYTEEDVV